MTPSKETLEQLNRVAGRHWLHRLVRRLCHCRWVGCFLSSYRWFRRLHGGHWERWNVDHPVCSAVWCDVDKCISETDQREPGWRGTPICETWP